MPTPTQNAILFGNLDAEVRAYRDAINANGGSAPSSWITSVNSFVKGCKADGIWDSLVDVGLLCGVDNLNAALVKLKTFPGVSRILTNNNFVSADYTPSGSSAGLLGNGSTKYLETSVPILSLDKSNFSMGAYGIQGDNGTGGFIGASYNATGDTNRFYLARGVGVGSNMEGAIGNIFAQFTSQTPGLYAIQTTGTTGYSRFKNGATESTLSTWNNNGFQSGTVRVFKGSAVVGNDRTMMYFVGNNLNQSALSNRVNALMASIGANQY